MHGSRRCARRALLEVARSSRSLRARRAQRISAPPAPRLRLQPRRTSAGERIQPRARDGRIGRARSASRSPRPCARCPSLRNSRWWCSASTMSSTPPIRCGGCCRIAPKRSKASTRSCRSSRAAKASRRSSCFPKGRAFLIAELGGATEDEARERAEKIDSRSAPQSGMRRQLPSSQIPLEQTAVWRLRESGLGSGAYFPGSPRTWPGAEDLAVPPAKLGAFLRRFAEILAQHKLQVGTYYGHFGEGCVHCANQFRSRQLEGNCYVQIHDGGAGRRGRRIRRLAFGRAWRRAGALGIAAEDFQSQTHRGVSRVQTDFRSAAR